ncbi:hypothetical protein [Polynucleobacter sp. JS-JIR-5-A7]|uniref:hypothetical protein n=1 Tax=Polynucleobacter sp. JS-JIR-5-A7 TaxID=1758395 RepID=UPI001BFE6555|nr:hypothetical protein [Polynucleobacter sp. JS-JIR-5-A7]QWE06947.1 hypothetical protein AOC29_01715 [Polynucleobacter sp. JS-JIR-5-A7]
MSNRPFILVAGRYSEKSAGLKAMYMVCDSLNKMGFNAYILVHPFYPPAKINSYPYLCPILNQETINYFNSNNISPIFIYSENIKGAPYGGSVRLRYYLYFPGAWGGNISEPDHMLISFSRAISKDIIKDVKYLMPPLINTKIFQYIDKKNNQSCGICYYSEKFESNGGVIPVDIKKNGLKITRYSYPNMNQRDIYEIFKVSKYFYVYENTGLIIEALISGVIVVIMPESGIRKMDLVYGPEINWSGVSFGNAQEDLNLAERSLPYVQEYYSNIISNFNNNLKSIAVESFGIPYNFKKIPAIPGGAYIDLLNNLYYPLTIISILRVHGINHLLNYCKRYIKYHINACKNLF